MAMSESTLAQSKSHAVALPALTVEIALYVALAISGFVLRVLVLDAVPLAGDEARQALASWNFLNGTPNPYTGSPLLFAGNVLVFALFGATDGAARVLPALFGVGLILLPACLRRELGRAGAVIASGLFTFSPSLVLFSRTANGAIIAVTSALAALTLGWRYATDRSQRDLNVCAVFVALALLSGREAWSIILPLAILVLAQQVLHRSEDEMRKIEWRQIAFWFVFVFVGVATLFLLRREGIGAAFDLFGNWLVGLAPSLAVYDPLRLLVVYDPIPLFFGIAGLVQLGFVRVEDRNRTLFNAFAFWLTAAFVLYSLGGDKSPEREVVLVVPLAIFAGWYIGAWLEYAVREIELDYILAQELPVFLFACAIVAYFYLTLAEFATRGTIFPATAIAAMAHLERTPELDAQVTVALIGIGTIALALLAIATVGWRRARTVGLAVLLALLTAWTIRQTAMVNYPGGELNSRDYLIARAGAANVRDLERDLHIVSRWQANDSITLSIIADESLNPAAAWIMRDFRKARFAAHPVVTQDAQALLLPSDAPAPGSGWIGQTYHLETQRSVSALSSLIRWLLFRDLGNLNYIDATLWIQQPQ
jgi:uncharacterized protein (TIGR03663 family)